MAEESTAFFTNVQRYLHSLGQSISLSQDERDIVDDYEAQEFGPKECAEHILRGRRS